MRLDSWQFCLVAGAGGLSLLPGEEGHLSFEEEHPFMVIAGPRLGVAWQVYSSIYIKTFVEFQGSLAKVHLSFNGIDRSNEFPFVGGMFGIQLGMVVDQPARWDRPASRVAVVR